MRWRVGMIIAKVVTLQAGYRSEQEEVKELGWNIDDELKWKVYLLVVGAQMLP